MNKSILSILVTSALTVTSSAVFAADEGFYLGGGLGQSRTTNSTTNVSTTGTSFKLIGGYAFNQNFAVEAEYVDLGTFAGVTGADIKGTAVGASAVGTIPLGEVFSLYGKVGVASVSTTATAQPGWMLLVPATQTKSGVSFGIGGAFNVSPNAAIRLSIDSYQFDALASNLTGRVATYGVAGVFKF